MLHTYTYKQAFVLESGATLSDLTIAYTTLGQMNAAKDNILWVFHALSGSSNVMDWWPDLFGPGCLLDYSKYFVICANTIGSPYGSTRPQSLDFPIFTVRDIVKAQLLLAEHLDIQQIHLLIGGSFGGSQALEFAFSYSGKVENMALFVAAAKESPWSIAIHEAQRMTLQADPTFGQANGGKVGLKAARAVGMLTYRSADSLNTMQQEDVEGKVDGFKAASYMQYHGQKFTERFDSLAYYYLSKCMDTHDIGRGRGGYAAALKQITVPTLAVAIRTDLLIPHQLMEEMAELLPNSTYHLIDSIYGHDGFLTEIAKIGELLGPFLEKTENVNV